MSNSNSQTSSKPLEEGRSRKPAVISSSERSNGLSNEAYIQQCEYSLLPHIGSFQSTDTLDLERIYFRLRRQLPDKGERRTEITQYEINGVKIDIHFCHQRAVAAPKEWFEFAYAFHLNVKSGALYDKATKDKRAVKKIIVSNYDNGSRFGSSEKKIWFFDTEDQLISLLVPF